MPRMGATIAAAPGRRRQLERILEPVPQPIRAQIREVLGIVQDDSVRSALRSEAWSGAAVANLPPQALTKARAVLVDLLRPRSAVDPAEGGTARERLAAEHGLTQVSLKSVGPKAYAAGAREALLSYLPKADVDSSKSLQGYLKDPSYVHNLSKNAAGGPEYTSGFTMRPHGIRVGDHPATVLQLDFCSLLERDPPNEAAGKLELERVIQAAGERAKKAGGAPPDFVFVEASGTMLDRYRELGFGVFALPGAKSDGDAYAMMALPLNDEAKRAVVGSGDFRRSLWNAHVEAWLDTNWGPGWRKDERAVAAHAEMTDPRASGPRWSQVLPE